MLKNIFQDSENSIIFVPVIIAKMKAILINPENQTITEIDIKKGINPIYKALDCDTFAAPVTYDNGDTMYCDDEGLFKEQKGGIIMPDWAYMIVGKILVLGCDNETGESKDVETPVDFFKKHIIWKSEDEVKKYQSNFI